MINVILFISIIIVYVLCFIMLYKIGERRAKKNISRKEFCENCKHFDILNYPKITNICMSPNVLLLKMQIQPHKYFCCIHYEQKTDTTL